VTPLKKLALYLARRPWLPAIGPRLVTVDTAVQRWSGGRFAASRLAGLTSVLLTTTGRRTGQPRHTPLIAIPEGGSLLLVASNFGKPGHPAWSANLMANPEATIHTRGHSFPVTTVLLTGTERDQAWATATEVWPAYHDYTARSGRELRIFRATRR
jgi:deazaflavin-dependent oxidoreductase (nitroreductase family)